MLNTFEMDDKRYIILPDDSIELFDNWLVGVNLRLAEEQKRLTQYALDAGDSAPADIVLGEVNLPGVNPLDPRQ